MIDGAYLSDAINLDDLSPNALNIVEAPCGCGKTTFAIKRLPEKAKSKRRMLMLIDTVLGSRRILNEQGTTRYSRFWRENYLDHDYQRFSTEDSEINIMTYYTFGLLLKHDTRFINKLDVIVCDEFHNAFVFRDFSKDTGVYDRAIDNIKYLSLKSDCFTVALTATPNQVIKNFHAAQHMVKPTRPVRCYESYKVQRYRNLDICVDEIQPGVKCLLYIQSIEEMLKYQKVLEEKGISCKAIWSIHNKEHLMSDEQYAVLDHIVDHEEIPPYIDTLIINASCGTSININGHIDRVIVHDENPDVITQVRGRYRDDLNTLYSLDKHFVDLASLGDYLNISLLPKEKDELCNALSFADRNGRIYGWTTVKKYLLASGYRIEEVRENDKRISVIRNP